MLLIVTGALRDEENERRKGNKRVMRVFFCTRRTRSGERGIFFKKKTGESTTTPKISHARKRTEERERERERDSSSVLENNNNNNT